MSKDKLTLGTVMGFITNLRKSVGRVKSDLQAVDGKTSAIVDKMTRVYSEGSANLFDKTKAAVGYVQKTGTIRTGGAYDSYHYSDFIPVAKDDYIAFYNKIYSSVATQKSNVVTAYDANGDAVQDSGAENVYNYTVPAGIAKVRVTFNSVAFDTFMLIKNSQTAPTAYIPYQKAENYYKAAEGFIPEGLITPENCSFIENGKIDPNLIPGYGSFPLNLPSKVYASIGVEMNIWFDNIVDGHDTDYDFDVTCSVGMQMERCYRITAETAGTYDLTIKAVRKKDGATVEKTTSLIVASDSAGSGTTKSVIILGDSTTWSGTAVSKLHDNFTGDVMSLTTLGTMGTSPNNHEGRSGWKFYYYMTMAEDANHVTNAFWNPTAQKFDADYYFDNTSITKPDFFVINLGINDVFGIADDSSLQTSIETIVGYCDAMIASVKTASPASKICVCLTIPPNYSQDPFGKWQNSGQTRRRCKRNNALLVERFISEYDEREDEGIYIIPIHVALDTVYNMQLETIAVNARNSDVTYSSPVANAAVHPYTSGYWQIADVYKAFLKANV